MDIVKIFIKWIFQFWKKHTAARPGKKHKGPEPYFYICLLARELDISEYEIFNACYIHLGYPQQTEKAFAQFLITQEIPLPVLKYCKDVLDGKCAFKSKNKTFSIF